MTSPTPSTKREDELAQIIIRLFEPNNGFGAPLAKVKLLAWADQYARAICEEAIGVEEELGPRPPALDGSAWEEFTTKEHRNELRAEQRTKLNELLGKPKGEE